MAQVIIGYLLKCSKSSSARASSAQQVEKETEGKRERKQRENMSGINQQRGLKTRDELCADCESLLHVYQERDYERASIQLP